MLPSSNGKSIQIPPESTRGSDAITVGAITCLQSCSSHVGQTQHCLTGSCEHTIWLTLFPFYRARSSPLLPSPPEQLISGYHIPISTGLESLFAVCAIVSLITSDFGSDFGEQLPILLSVKSCRFSFCCLVSGTTGQCRPSACTLLPFVICSILQLLVSLSCQRHCKTE